MLNILLNDKARGVLEKFLLPLPKWKAMEAKMPKECADVVIGEACYCGCEAIGFTEALGWYLVVWEPTEEPALDRKIPVGDSGGSLAVGVQVCGGPTEKDPGQFTLIYAQNEEAVLKAIA